jgi:hypothetical protein
MTIRIYEPVPIASDNSKISRQSLAALKGKTVGFIDNAKPNFEYLAEDLGALLVEKYGVAEVVTHRKRGQHPVGDAIMADLARKCDAIVTGSGD